MRREVIALREALEQAHYAHAAERSRLMAGQHADNTQSHALAVALREQLDATRKSHLEELQALSRRSAAEIRVLQESLQAARAQFDAALGQLQDRHAGELREAARLRAELEATVRQLRIRLDERP